MSAPQYDRNLLFGILAVQMDFIGREALIAALNAWVLSKQKPLGDILVEQKVLPLARRDLLDALVAEHLKQHGDDPAKSLAAVSSIGSVRAELDRLGDTDIQASLGHLSVAQERDPFVTQASVGASTSQGMRFRILRPYAEGGLGKVSVARDKELGREVALKEIKEQHADELASRTRFLVEAEITGGLEHPGIVPVYGLGQYADGRPYYAMRFIRGDSLQEAVDRYHGSRIHLAPRDASLEFRNLLGRFLDVCNAIDYAHSRGVLHRDLKPGNIVLGRYGETLVVDWGLAKATGTQELAGESAEGVLHPTSGSDSAPTQMGNIIGTPQYMSPEQAAGRLDLLGPASDVYSLGATLYYLLTGRAPIKGDTVAEVLRKVERGEFPRPRRIAPKTPRPLEAICLKAMALKSEERYATPKQLADEIEHWLADEPVAAYRDPLFSRIARAARRHKVATASLAALLIAAVVGLSLGTVLLGREQARTEAARKLEMAAKDEAVANLHKAEEARRDALAAADREKAASDREKLAADLAQENYALALKTLHSAIFNIQRKLVGVPAAQEVRRDILKKALQGLEALAAHSDRGNDSQVDRNTEVATKELGDVMFEVGDDAGLHGLEKARDLYARALVIGQRLAQADPKSTQAQRDLTVSYWKLGDVTLQMGDATAARKFYEQFLEVNQRLAEANPKDIDAQRGLSIAYGKLGDVTLQMGDAAASKKFYEQSRDISQRLVQSDPKNVNAQREMAVACERLGDAKLKMGDVAAARKLYEQESEIFQQLVQTEPNNAQAQRDLATACGKLGDLTLQMGDAAAAVKFYRQDVEINQQLVQADPKNAKALHFLAASFERLGNVTLQLRDAASARKLFDQCMEVSQRIAQADPKNTQAQRDLSVSFRKLGDVMLKTGDTAAARGFYEQALEVSQRLAEADPKNIKMQRDLSVSHVRLGDVMLVLGDSAAARKFYEKCLDVRQRLAEADPNDAQAQRDLIVSLCKIGELELKGETKTAAKEWFQKAMKRARQMIADHQLDESDDFVRSIQIELKRCNAAVKNSSAKAGKGE